MCCQHSDPGRGALASVAAGGWASGAAAAFTISKASTAIALTVKAAPGGDDARLATGDLGMRFMIFNSLRQSDGGPRQPGERNLIVALAEFIGEWAGAAMRFVSSSGSDFKS